MHKKNTKIRILSIDGGGIRGIIPGAILAYLEDALGKRVGRTVALSEYFDLIAGTSTGGILTCAYLVPDIHGAPKYTAREALDLYLEHGDEIFQRSFWEKLRRGAGLLDERYPVKAMEQVLESYFGDLMLSDFTRPGMITSYDIRNRCAKFFTSSDAEKPERNFKVRDIARATSAAPTYFEPALIHSELGVAYALIDGGVFANNPTMCAYSEARQTRFSTLLKNTQKPDFPTAADMLIVSVGTGSNRTPYHYDSMKDRGLAHWISPLIDIMMSGNAETVHYQLQQIFDSRGPEIRENYYRLEPNIYNADSAIDNVSDENLQALHEAGLFYVSTHADQLDAIVDKLIENH